jgi:hypothetical protein
MRDLASSPANVAGASDAGEGGAGDGGAGDGGAAGTTVSRRQEVSRRFSKENDS